MLKAIQDDDLKSFNALMIEAQCGIYRLGRFPVLSLMYLYCSRSIISAYEERFAKISSWNELDEPICIVEQFAKKAGKCLRLYSNEVVSPLEMLLILDRTRRLRRIYPLTNASNAVKTRLQSLYYIKYSLGIKFEGDKIIPDKRPLKRSEKKRIATACASCLLAAALIVAVPVTTVSYVREHKGEVSGFDQIDFGAKTTYKLKSDITVPAGYSTDKMNCTLVGNGHRIVMGEGASFGNLYGSIKDAEISTSGSPVFNLCSENSLISNVTFNVSANVHTGENSSFIAVTNYGTIDGVSVNVGGKISAVADGADELVFGGMVIVNFNIIQNCTVSYSDFTLEGETQANATFGGIVGVNNGAVQGCTVKGAITSDTFDLAGVCYTNYGTISGSENEADLSQISESDEWNPVIGGIVIDNVGSVAYCKNLGDIYADGQNEAVCGGIAARAYYEIVYCLSQGDITVLSPTVYAGGIFGLSAVAMVGRDVYCFGFANRCLVKGKISVTLGDGKAYVGGIGGYIKDNPVNQTYIGGSILSCIYMGQAEDSVERFGNVVGVCGARIYESNSYPSGNQSCITFDGNLYIENGKPSFGAVETDEGRFSSVEGKGARSLTEEEITSGELYEDILKNLGL